MMCVPLLSISCSLYQALWWALKSPPIIMLGSVFRCERSGVYFLGHSGDVW